MAATTEGTKEGDAYNSRIDLALRSPSPLFSDDDDDDEAEDDPYQDRLNVRLRRTRRRRTSESPPSRASSKGQAGTIRSPRNSDSGFSNSTASMTKGFVVGPPERNIYGNERMLDESDSRSPRSRSRQSRAESPPDRPSWGFGPSRSGSRMEEDYLNGAYDSDGSLGSNRSKSRMDDDANQSSKSKKKKKKRAKDDSKLGLVSDARSRKITSKFKEDSDSYRATKITLFKNGDPWFGSKEYRFRLGKDLNNLDGLFHNVSSKMDFINGVAFMFDTEGTRITSIDQVVDGGEYVCSQNRKFIIANYGRTGDTFLIDSGASRSSSRMKRLNYFKKTNSAPSGKPGSGEGRIIKIVNADDHSITEKVLLNLKTTQTFEDVVADLGQVLKIKGANKLYSKSGREIRSFSHLKMDFSNVDTFVVSAGPSKFSYISDNSEDDEDDRPRYRKSSVHRYNSDPNLSQGLIRKKPKSRSMSRSPSRADDGGAGTSAIKVNVHGIKKIVYPPTSGFAENTKAPNEKLLVDWVYGYRGRDVSQNLWLVSNGDILYFVGTIAVLYNKLSDSQRHYIEHTEDIQCMDVHPSKEFVVSGQGGGLISDSKPHIRIWSALNLETKVILGLGECEKGISGVAFSVLNKGDYVMCVDQGKEAKMSVWQWKKKELLGRAATDQKMGKGCTFHPLDNNLIITFGQEHLVFWNRRKDGFFERSDVVKSSAKHKRFITCVEFLESGDLVTGDADGMISTYSVSNEGEYYRSQEVEGHKTGGVASLLLLNEHTVVSGGDSDGRVVAWDCTREFQMLQEAKLPEAMGCARTIISQHADSKSGDGSMFIGTTKNTIVEGSVQHGFSVMVWGHTGEVKALAPHPDDLAFVTAGQDKNVVKWRKQKVVWKLSVPSKCTAAAYHPNGHVVAVGTDEGHLLAINGDTGSHIATVKVGGSAINVMAFNKAGDGLALGSKNGSVYVYTSSRDGKAYKKYGKIAGGQGLLHIDWSVSGELLQCVNDELDLTFWNIKTYKVDRNGAPFRDIDWLEYTCTVSYPVAGAWNNVNARSSHEDPEVTSAHAGDNRGLLVTGDSHGCVRLFRFPCTSASAGYDEDKPVSGSVSVARFLYDDIFVVACGGEEATLVRWKIK